jgi:biopolymer transport protein ExbB/TolQ
MVGFCLCTALGIAIAISVIIAVKKFEKRNADKIAKAKATVGEVVGAAKEIAKTAEDVSKIIK